MRVLVLTTAALALAACGSETSGTFESGDGGRGEYTVDTEGGDTTATITTEDGTATMQTGPNVKADLPLGFTVYPDATVLSTTNINAEGEKGSMVMMESSDSAQEIAEFYREKAEDAGIEIQMDMTINDGKMLAGEGPGGISFSINASPQGSATSAQLMVSEGSGN